MNCETKTFDLRISLKGRYYGDPEVICTGVERYHESMQQPARKFLLNMYRSYLTHYITKPLNERMQITFRDNPFKPSEFI